MKISKSLMLALLSTSLFVACTTSTTSNEETSEETSSTKEACMYSYISDSTALRWTAYKFTDRAGVGGTFNDITISNTQVSEDIFDVLVGAEFLISTASINSGDATRDPKVVEFFFKTLVDTETISGKINSIDGGEAIVSIRMNERTVDYVGKITAEEEKISLSVSIDMNDFDGMAAIDVLNEMCSLLHTGEDGESKLWSDISIVVTTVLKKECN